MATDGIDLKMKMSGDEKVRRDMRKTGKSAKDMGKKMQEAGSAAGALGGSLGGVGTVLAAGPTLMNPFTAAVAAAAAGLVAAAAAAKLTKDAFVGTIRGTLELADELDNQEGPEQGRPTPSSAISDAMALFGVETNATIKATEFNRREWRAPGRAKTLTKAFERPAWALMSWRHSFCRSGCKIAPGFRPLGIRPGAADASLLFGRMSRTPSPPSPRAGKR